MRQQRRLESCSRGAFSLARFCARADVSGVLIVPFLIGTAGHALDRGVARGQGVRAGGRLCQSGEQHRSLSGAASLRTGCYVTCSMGVARGGYLPEHGWPEKACKDYSQSGAQSARRVHTGWMVLSSQDDQSRLPFLRRWSRRRARWLTRVTHITACLKHGIRRGFNMAMVEPCGEIR